MVKNNLDKTESSALQLFAIPLWRLALLSFVTVGLYDAYWFYRNWKALQPTDPRIKHPFWRAIFSLFYCLSLFKRIAELSKQAKRKPGYKPTALAVVYILFLLSSSVWARATIPNRALDLALMLLLSLEFVPLLFVQKAIRNIQRQQGRLPAYRPRPWEAVLVAGGVLLFALVLWVVLWAPADLTPAEQTRADALKTKADRLYTQYQKCSDELNKQYDSVDKNNNAQIDRYNAKFDKCEAVRKEQNKAADEYNKLVGL